MSRTPEHSVSSGNVFEDLGFSQASELQAKADLAHEISRIIDERSLTQAEAADLLGVDQPKISALVRGRLTGFSMERLYRYLIALGKDIEIVVRPRASESPGSRLRVNTIHGRSRTASAPRSKPRSRSKSKAGK